MARPGREPRRLRAVGTGKNHFAEALANAVIDAGMQVSWFSLKSMTATLSRAKVDGSVQKVRTRICRAEVIAIDDIGMLPANTMAAEAFCRVVDVAYERRSLIVGSNIRPSGFDTIMPKSIATAAVKRRLHLVATEGPSVPLEEAMAGAGLSPSAHSEEVSCPATWRPAAYQLEETSSVSVELLISIDRCHTRQRELSSQSIFSHSLRRTARCGKCRSQSLIRPLRAGH
jgi:hypothetical protein